MGTRIQADFLDISALVRSEIHATPEGDNMLFETQEEAKKAVELSLNFNRAEALHSTRH